MALAARLAVTVRCVDFLQWSSDIEDLGLFDALLLNPPFAQGADTEHITHALTMSKTGGRLVALCANGPARSPAFARWSRLAAVNGRTCRPTPPRNRGPA